MKTMIIAILLFVATGAFAKELTVGEYRETRIWYPKTVSMLLNSLYLGYVGVENGKPLYVREACAPDSLTARDLSALVDGFIATTPHISDLTLGEVLFMALKERYPCK